MVNLLFDFLSVAQQRPPVGALLPQLFSPPALAPHLLPPPAAAPPLPQDVSLPLKRGMLYYAHSRKLPVQVVIGANKEAIISEKHCTARFNQTAVVGYSGERGSRRGRQRARWAAMVSKPRCARQRSWLFRAGQASVTDCSPWLGITAPACHQMYWACAPPDTAAPHRPARPMLQNPSSPLTTRTLSPSGPRCRRPGMRSGLPCLVQNGKVGGGGVGWGGVADWGLGGNWGCVHTTRDAAAGRPAFPSSPTTPGAGCTAVPACLAPNGKR